MVRSRLPLALVACAMVLASCGSSGGSGAAATSTTTAAPATTPAPATTLPAATTAPSTSAPCTLEGDTARVAKNFPDTLSTLVGKDIRYAVFDACTERVVIELQGTGTFPGYQVMYEDAPTLGESEEPVTMPGDAILVATLGSWMTNMEGQGYTGPSTITAKGTKAIKELQLIENFEGVTRWAIGLDTKRPFTVSVLDNPPRLVVDVAVQQ